VDRRRFLQATGALTLGAATLPTVLAACGGGDDDKTASGSSGGGGGGGGGNRKVKLGFIALTDCASIVLADKLGYFSDLDLEVELAKQESWPVTRDNLLRSEIDGAHCLFGMPFSVATKIGGDGSRDLKIAMTLNNNGQAITLANSLDSAGYGDLDAANEALAAAGTPQLAMTFPGGTHDTWLRYWLMAAGVKFTDVDIQPVPPPQMVQNMSVGNVVGYCVGEPWGAVAVDQGIGFTHLTTQDLWENHPEKALVVGKRLSTETDVLKDVMAAVLKASKWLDEPDNRSEAADTLGVPEYVNAQPDAIRGRLTGEYDMGADIGEKSYEGTQMQFFRDGETNFPRKAHGLWFLAQYQRFGLLQEAPAYQELVDDIILSDLYKEVAEAEGIAVPDDDMAPFEVKLDGITFDPTKPEEEATRT
jgi:nitrate/nitrite transport system substrate-binding protein